MAHIQRNGLVSGFALGVAIAFFFAGMIRVMSPEVV